MQAYLNCIQMYSCAGTAIGTGTGFSLVTLSACFCLGFKIGMCMLAAFLPSSLWNIQDLCPIFHLLASFFEFGIFSQMWMNVPWGLMTAIQMLYVKIPRSCTSACAKWVTLAKGRNVKVKWWNCSALPCLSNCTSAFLQGPGVFFGTDRISKGRAGP